MNHDELQHRIAETGQRIRNRIVEVRMDPPRLRTPTMCRLLDTFKMFEEPVDLEQFPARALKATKYLFGVDFCWYGEVDTAKMRASAVFESSLAPSGSLVDTWSRFMLEEPTLSHWKWPEPGFAMKTSDYVPLAQLERMPIYERYLRPWAIEQSLFAPILRTSNRVISVGFGRKAHDFSEEDRYALMLLSLFLYQCRRGCESSSIARAHRSVVHDDLSVAEVELVVLGRDGRVRSMSSRAAEIIQRHVGAFPRYSPRLPDRLGAYVVNTPRPRSSLYFSNLLELSLAAAKEAAARGAGVLEVFTMNDGDEVSLYLCHHEQLSDETLARAIGTSERPAEVGRYLCRGETRQGIANQLHISVATVRKHFEELYHKLDVKREVAAVNALRRRVTDYLRHREGR
jgi:DNA-binding CsgD family transcriptional regulator